MGVRGVRYGCGIFGNIGRMRCGMDGGEDGRIELLVFI